MDLKWEVQEVDGTWQNFGHTIQTIYVLFGAAFMMKLSEAIRSSYRVNGIQGFPQRER